MLKKKKIKVICKYVFTILQISLGLLSVKYIKIYIYCLFKIEYFYFIP